MVKLLLKKQLAEIFRAYLYNQKKNKARSKAGIILMFVLFAAIMLGVLGGMFGAIAWAMAPIVEAGYGWFYFAMFTGIGILLGAFGSVFNTYAGLYMAKDNDQLLAMPIPVGAILKARLLSVYLMGLMYSAVVTISASVIYFVKAGVTLSGVCGCLVWLLAVSIIVFTLSCILGYVVAILSTKLKHKNFMTVAAAIVFIGLYYFFYFKASAMLQDILLNIAQYGESLKHAAYPLYLIGKIPMGDWKGILATIVVCVVLVAAVWLILSRSFLKIATSTGRTEHITYREKHIKRKSLAGAMLAKEFGRFTGSANYMLNCGLGILLLPALGIAMLIKGEFIADHLDLIFGDIRGAVAVLLVGMVIIVAAMNDMVAPSVSLEGKSIWITQSLPVPAIVALRSKLLVHLILTSLPALFCSICIGISCKLRPVEFLWVILLPQLYVWLFALFGLFMGMRKPNLNWTNEVYPVKQSFAVFVTLFGGWVYAIAVIGIYLWKGFELGTNPYLSIVTAITVCLILLLEVWLHKKAPKIFEQL